MSLRLVSDHAPQGRVLTANSIRGRQRRAGDRREPLRLEVSAGIERFLAAAAEQGVQYDCAVGLGLERLLVLAALRKLDIEGNTASAQLNAAAADVRLSQAKNPQDAHYLRRLGATKATPLPVAAGQVLPVSVPGRLLDRVTKLPLPWQLCARDVPEMIRWEIAATAQGYTMVEWAALTLLAEVAPSG